MRKNTKFLYRIVKWEHLVDLFESETLYFARPFTWDDPYELRIDHPAMSKVFAQCWCRRGVSDAMWRIYSPTHYGVRIKVQRAALVEQLRRAKSLVPFKYRKIGSIKYRRQSEIDHLHKDLVAQLEQKYKASKALESLMYKRNAFNHEAETRVLLYANGIPNSDTGIRVPVEPFKLVETILADPRMPEPIYQAFKYYMKNKLHYSGSFGRSTIYSTQDPLRVGYDDDEI